MQRVALYHPGDYSYIFNNDDTATLLEYKPSGSNDTIEHIVIPNYVESAGVRYTVTGVTRAAIVNKDIKSVYFLHDMRNVALDAFYNVRNRDDIDDERNINCTRLADIYVEPGNFNIGSEDGVLYSMAWDKEKQEYVPSELLYYPVGNTAEEFTTIDGISVLPEFAFWGAKNLKSVNIYDTVQDIGYSSGMGESQEHLCFEGCSNLVFVNIIHSDGQKATNIRYYSDNGVLYRWNPNVDTTGAPVTLVYYPKGKREISELIKKMRIDNPNLTLISITHDVEEAFNSDEIIVMNEGEIYMSGSPKEILSKSDELEKIHLGVPFLYSLARELNKLGIKVDDYSSLESLVNDICR